MKRFILHRFIVVATTPQKYCRSLSSSSTTSQVTKRSSADDIYDVQKEIEEDKAWISIHNEKMKIIKKIEVFTSDQPKSHILTDCLKTYLINRGVSIEQRVTTTPETSTSKEKHTYEEIIQKIEETTNLLMKCLSMKDFVGVAENEEKLNKLEILKNAHGPTIQHDKKQERAKPRETKAKINTTNTPESRFMSSFVTFPLSLGYGIRNIFSHPINNLSILVIGARSESALPTM